MSTSTHSASPRRSRTGPVMVVGLMVLAVVATVGVALFRHHARQRFGNMVELGEAERIRAYSGLLNMNGLRSLSRRYAYLPPETETGGACGSPFLKVRDFDEGALYVLRGADMHASAEDVRSEGKGLVIVSRPNGRILYTVEDACPFAVGGPDATRAVLFSRHGDTSFLWLVGEEAVPALCVRGLFRLETAEGTVVLGSPDGLLLEPPVDFSAPLFRWDADGNCVRGPAGGTGQPWEVDAALSGLYCEGV